MENITFEESITQLENIVSQLERGDVPLEEALEAFQKRYGFKQAMSGYFNESRKDINQDDE